MLCARYGCRFHENTLHSHVMYERRMYGKGWFGSEEETKVDESGLRRDGGGLRRDETGLER